MNPQLKMLVWKEWRERRSQWLLCLTFVLAPPIWAVIAVVVSLARGKEPYPLPWAFLIWLYGLVMPIFIAMRSSWNAATERTAAFTRGLPVRPRQASLVELVGGIATLVTPIPLFELAVYLVSIVLSQIEDSLLIKIPFMPATWVQVEQLWIYTLVIAITTVGCYLQLVVLGTFLRNENRLAFYGVVWTIMWLAARVIWSNSSLNDGKPSEHRVLEALFPQVLSVFALNWFGGTSIRDHRLAFGSQVWEMIAANLAVAAALTVVFVYRQGRILARGSSTDSRWLPAGLARLRGRFAWRWRPVEGRLATRTTALVWLTLRQTLPMCLAGLVIAVVLSVVETQPWDWPLRPRRLVLEAAGDFPRLIILIGFLWASVVGAVSLADEFDARCGDFWRTRPIPLWRLFTVKFLVGLAAVLLVLDGSALATARMFPGVRYRDWEWAYIACFFPLHAAMFAVAVAWACALRKVALAAMATIVSYAAVYFAFQLWADRNSFAPFDTFERMLMVAQANDGSIDLTMRGYPQLAAVLGGAIVVSFLIAGFSLARYQPWRQLD